MLQKGFEFLHCLRLLFVCLVRLFVMFCLFCQKAPPFPKQKNKFFKQRKKHYFSHSLFHVLHAFMSCFRSPFYFCEPATFTCMKFNALYVTHNGCACSPLFTCCAVYAKPSLVNASTVKEGRIVKQISYLSTSARRRHNERERERNI